MADKKRKLKLLIDTDPGVDDALSLLLALFNSNLSIKGITTTYGNHNLGTTAKNAASIISFANTLIPKGKRTTPPLVKGAKKPLKGLHKPFFKIHGESGIGGFDYPSDYPVKKASVEDFIKENVSSNAGQITILCLGPLTNLARFASKYPEECKKVKKVVISGGAIFYPGNLDPLVEANFGFDPEAAGKVLRAPFEKISLVPLNATEGFELTKEKVDFVKNKKLKKVITKLISSYNDYYKKEKKYTIDPKTLEKNCHSAGVIHDVVALFTLLLDNAQVEKSTVNCRVVEDGPFAGQTYLIPTGEYETKKGEGLNIVKSLDKDKFWKEFFQILNKYE